MAFIATLLLILLCRVLPGLFLFLFFLRHARLPTTVMTLAQAILYSYSSCIAIFFFVVVVVVVVSRLAP